MDTNNDEHNEDIVYDEDHGAELVKKVRAKLKKCEQEKKEYLDGWQRLKADTLNARKEQAASLTHTQNRTRESFLHSILPGLDSFDIALQGEGWKSVDEGWRKGVEHVHNQILDGLKSEGITRYGAPGEEFDTQLHEAVGHEEGGDSGTIAFVKRFGYKIGETVVRAAQVTIFE